MPIYEYRRPDGTTFEIQQSFHDDPLKVDPDSGVPVERVFHPPAVHFKGKGFYNTDYGTRKRQREAAAEDSSSSASKEKETGTGGAQGSSSGDGVSSSNGSGRTDSASKPKASKPAPAGS